MKHISLLTLLLFLTTGLLYAQSGDEKADACGPDSMKTSVLNISTGIGLNGSSDSVLMTGGYGYNAYYTRPNDHYDTLWRVTFLSSKYNPRTVDLAYKAYTGPYLKAGGHPFILDVDTSILSRSYSVFCTGDSCSTPSTAGIKKVSNWISVYGDGGGQNRYIANNFGDGYMYERCFYLCGNDTTLFDLYLMADDIVDTVKVDDSVLFVDPDPYEGDRFLCKVAYHISRSVRLSGGRHRLSIYTRDIYAGHLGLNVYGHIFSAREKRNIIRSRFDSRCNYVPVPVTGIAAHALAPSLQLYPNPVHQSLTVVHTEPVEHIEITDILGRVKYSSMPRRKELQVDMSSFPAGWYIVHINDSYVQKVCKD